MIPTKHKCLTVHIINQKLYQLSGKQTLCKPKSKQYLTCNPNESYSTKYIMVGSKECTLRPPLYYVHSNMKT